MKSNVFILGILLNFLVFVSCDSDDETKKSPSTNNNPQPTLTTNSDENETIKDENKVVTNSNQIEEVKPVPQESSVSTTSVMPSTIPTAPEMTGYELGELTIFLPRTLTEPTNKNSIHVTKSIIDGVDYLSIPHFLTTLNQNDDTTLTAIVDVVAYSKDCPAESARDLYLAKNVTENSEILVNKTVELDQFRGNVYLTQSVFSMGSLNVYKMYLAAFNFEKNKCYALDLQIENIGDLSTQKLAEHTIVGELISAVKNCVRELGVN